MRTFLTKHRPVSLIELAVFAGLWVGCNGPAAFPTDPSTPPGGPQYAREVVFQRLLEKEIPGIPGSSNFPSGVAVTPDGRWVVGLSFSNGSISLFDGETLERIAGPFGDLYSVALDTIRIVHPHAVIVSPDGSFGVLTNRTGVVGFDLPSMEAIFHTTGMGLGLGQPRHVVRDSSGRNYYVGFESGVARLSATGQIEAFFLGEPVTTAMALTRNELEIVAVTDWGHRLVVLGVPHLTPRVSVALPSAFEGEAVVSLSGDSVAVVVGGAPGWADTAVVAPVMALSVDLRSGALGALQVLDEDHVGTVAFSDGNDFINVGEATSVVPTAAGVVTIDAKSGRVSFHGADELQRELSPCCDVATYPDGRLIFSVADFIANAASYAVYEADEQLVPVLK